MSVCNFRYGYSVCCAYYGEGSGPIWLDGLSCNSNDQSLLQCDHYGWGNVYNCDSHSHDAGVRCYGTHHQNIGFVPGNVYVTSTTKTSNVLLLSTSCGEYSCLTIKYKIPSGKYLAVGHQRTRMKGKVDIFNNNTLVLTGPTGDSWTTGMFWCS